MSHKFQFIGSGTLARAAASAAAVLMLASCQTTAPNSAVQGDAAPPEAADALPVKKGSEAKRYSDPLVASAAFPVPPKATDFAAVAAGDGAIAAYAPAPANLGELTMQPTAVNASRNSLFSQAPVSQAPAAVEEPMPTAAEGTDPAADRQAVAAGASAGSTSIVVPADLPTRQVNPMSKSLFSAELREPEPPAVDEAALPAGSADDVQPVYATKEQPVYAEPAAAAEPVAGEDDPNLAQTAPGTDDPAAGKKRPWLPSLSKIFGKKKS